MHHSAFSILHSPFCIFALIAVLMACAPTTASQSFVPDVQLNATPVPATAASPIPKAHAPPTLEDFWNGAAQFVVDVPNTGLPMGESDTVLMPDGTLFAYVHASQRSANVHDQCSAPVEFPGCVVIYRSFDGGKSFVLAKPTICQFKCIRCPCDNEIDQINQQQYPRVFAHNGTYYMVYEHGANVLLRRSVNGLDWSDAEWLKFTGIWNLWYRPCAKEESIGQHPFAPYDYECLSGGPPGIFVEDEHIYVFVAMGQNPSHLGCFVGRLNQPGTFFERCPNNPLVTGAASYGPIDQTGKSTNSYFDFRTVSSAEVLKVNGRYYVFYEGVRGPGANDPGDTQFGLGLARSKTNELAGGGAGNTSTITTVGWEKFAGNPILVDLPGNIGLGHADLIVLNGVTHLFTSLDGVVRSRLTLIWKS